MSIFLRGKTWWYAVYRHGKLIRGSCNTADRLKAYHIEKDMQDAFKAESAPAKIIERMQGHLTDSDFPIDSIWAKFVANPGTKASSEHLMKVKQVCDDFIAYSKEVVGYKNVSQISNFVAQSYISYLQNNGKYNKTIKSERDGKLLVHTSRLTVLAPRTISYYLVNLKYIFRILTEGYGLMYNPFDEIKLKGVEKSCVKREAFTPDELRMIGKVAINSYLYPLFVTSVSTGLRLGDVCSLKWSEIKDDEIIKKTSKTGTVVHIPLLPSFKSYLDSLKKTSEYCYPELYKVHNEQPVKISKDTAILLRNCGIKASTEVDNRSRKAPIKGIHSLRHTFCYLAATSGIPLNVVQGIVGHLTSDMTKHYSDHADKVTKMAMLQKMPNYLRE